MFSLDQNNSVDEKKLEDDDSLYSEVTVYSTAFSRETDKHNDDSLFDIIIIFANNADDPERGKMEITFRIKRTQATDVHLLENKMKKKREIAGKYHKRRSSSSKGGNHHKRQKNKEEECSKKKCGCCRCGCKFEKCEECVPPTKKKKVKGKCHKKTYF